jgi:hypothetical protein
MRGSMRKRGRTYTWYLFVLDPATGKPGQRSKGGYRTKRECQAALNEALSTVRTGTFVEASKRTTVSFLRDEWLPAMRLNVRPSTWATYQGGSLRRTSSRRLGEWSCSSSPLAIWPASTRNCWLRVGATDLGASRRRPSGTFMCSCIEPSGTRCAGATRFGTWLTLLTRRR